MLSIEQKLEILDLLRKGASYRTIAETFGTGRSTIADIKRQEEKLRSFKRRITDMGIKKVKVKAMKMGSHKQLDEALYIWFRQQREKVFPSLEFSYKRQQSCSINDFTWMLEHVLPPAWDFDHDL